MQGRSTHITSPHPVLRMLLQQPVGDTLSEVVASNSNCPIALSTHNPSLIH